MLVVALFNPVKLLAGAAITGIKIYLLYIKYVFVQVINVEYLKADILGNRRMLFSANMR
jgi:hypothetical protein